MVRSMPCPGWPADAGDAGAPADAGDAGAPADADAGYPADASDAGPTALNVLFIGNSYTYVNDLPGMLAQIAATAGTPPTITTAAVTQGGATLEELWEGGVAQTQIGAQAWTHVVLQDESGQPLVDSSDFVTYAQRFESLIVDAGARPTLFVTWARAAGDQRYEPIPYGYFLNPGEMQDELTAAYASLARQPPYSLLACAGEAFRRSMEAYPEIVLQQSDFSHPTVAGTYLAACTFYVALTGQPVPAESAVPAGVDAQEAANLRDIAQVGSSCANVQPKAFVLWSDATWINPTFPAPDGGLQFEGPFDYGTAGTSIPNYFVLQNFGISAAGIADGMTLSPPFAWSDGVGFPGGSGMVTLDDGMTYPFCSSSLGPSNIFVGPNEMCVLAVSYTGATTGSGLLTLNLTNAYESSFARQLQGTSTSRALLQVSGAPGFFGCSNDACNGDAYATMSPEGVVAANFLVSNRGALPTTSLGVGTPLVPPTYWGPSGAGGAFPGGTGTGQLHGASLQGVSITYPMSYDYCTTQTLDPGQQCIVTVSFAPSDPRCRWSDSTAVNLAYSDAIGPVSPNANLNIQLPGLWVPDGGCPLPP
jgi:hypothetical protein